MIEHIQKTTSRLPDFVCIGAMRCGTTTLWDMLRLNDRVYLPQTKELHYFDNRNGVFDAGLDAYAEHFKDAREDQLVGEFTPSYLYLPEVCQRMYQCVPEAKLLVILRDPVERAWSHYQYAVRGGHEALRFDQAVDVEPDRLAKGDLETRIMFSYVDRGRYAQQLQRFADAFSRKQLCILFLEELKTDPQKAIKQVNEHLGLDALTLPAAEQTHRNKAASMPRNLHWHARWRKVQKFSWSGSTPVHRGARRLADAALRWNMTNATPQLPIDLRDRLDEIYRPCNEQLADWLGRPLPWQTKR